MNPELAWMVAIFWIGRKPLEAKYPSDKGRFVLDYMCLKK